MKVIGIEKQGQNWCKKWNMEITNFLVKVMCYEPHHEGCASCKEYTYKRTEKNTRDCKEHKTAIDCLKAHCDYAEAADGAFFCHKPKGAENGIATIETFDP